MIAAWAALAAAGEVHRYAVVVGANRGTGADAPLAYAERDAARVAWVLEELAGVRSEDIVHLRDADRGRVLLALDQLAGQIARRNPAGDESLLFVYYSGHGGPDGLRMDGTTLPFSELTEAIRAVGVDVRVLVVDACQSGELTRLKGAVPAEPFEIRADDRLDTEGMAVITSSSVGEDAQESDRLQGGIFTHHFLAGLMGAADASGDQRVTLTEAYRYGYAETVKATSVARFVQRPSFGFQLAGRSDLVLTQFAGVEGAATLLLSGPGEWWVFSGPSESVLLEVEVGDEAMLSIPPGPYLVRLRQPDRIRELQLELPAGESREVTAASMPTVPPGQSVRKGIEERGTAWGWTVGAGVTGPIAPGLPASPVGLAGVAVDLEPLTLSVRLAASGTRQRADALLLNQAVAGIEVAGVKKVDVRRVAVGLGVRVGGHGVAQWFDTPGDAPPRWAALGRVGPVLGFDVPLGRTVVTIGGGTDVQIYRRYDAITRAAALTSQVSPTFSMEWTRYVR